jgi:prevent-host-death family protein
MAATFNIHYAKTHLSNLLEQVQGGKEIIIAKAGKPIARLCPIEDAGNKTKPRRVPGSLKGKLVVPDDFDDPMPGFEDALYNGR